MARKGNGLVPEEIIEFQTDALEVKDERLPFGVRFCVWAPAICIVVAIIWASIARIDIIIPAPGKLVTDTQTIVMKPLERAVIKTVDVRIGDIVEANQVLMTFDPTTTAAEGERLRNEIGTFNAQLERLKCEFSGKPYNPKNKDIFEEWQRAIYEQRQAYYNERLNYFDESLSQIDASYKSVADSFSKQEERLKEVGKLEDMYEKLHGRKVASLKELIEMRITRMEMEATVDQLRNNLLELKHRRGSCVAEKNTFIQEWRNKLSEEMVGIERNYTNSIKEYDKIKNLIEYVYLRAPCRSVVHEIAAFSPGSAVREAEALITLVPLDDNIELESRIRPQDIGKIHVGDDVRIKLDAYPFQKHGTLNGKVRNVSFDTIQAGQGEQLQDENGVAMPSYYRARITVNGELKGVGKYFQLIPGMQAQGEIKTGSRRVIEYVLYPFLKALDEAAREP